MDHVRFDAGGITLVISCAVGNPPGLLYWGKQLPADIEADEIARLTTRQGAHGSENDPVSASLALEPGLGLMGPVGIAAHRRGRDWGSRFCVTSVDETAHSVIIHCDDPRAELGLDYRVKCDPSTGVIQVGCCLQNRGAHGLSVVSMMTACLPIPARMTEIVGFSGRWANEFARERLPRFTGAYVRENRRGRTSHDSFPAVILCSSETREQSGEAYGLHLAWSGNHALRVDSLADGRVFASLGALLLPGELELEPGETYESPTIVAAYSAMGFSELSRKFHGYVRGNLVRPQVRERPRPVHYNSWEAVYFDHDIDRLRAMASRAAEVGVERFVLDDGWFGSRRSDRSGLGDWIVSETVYPDGLKPLIDHVTGLGMEMGIWFEPEMVNLDSDLFRAHPDWILQVEGIEQVPFRNQYVLDISRPEVADHLFDRVSSILQGNAIGYVKWDMNRDLNHPGDREGQPRAHLQVRSLYDLLARLRKAHPQVEFESCASGGGRADMGILAHTDRVWTSDSNDALDRQMIQKGASYFLPLEVLGAHVGPRRCHITGRTLSMGIRAATALMGHMGVELDLLSASESDLVELKAGIALYKQHRGLIHSGDLYRLDTAPEINAFGVVAKDKSEALFSVAFVTGHATTHPPILTFDGLDANARYRVRLIWPEGWRSITSPSVMDAMQLGDGGGGGVQGDALMGVGLQLPLSHPETALLFHLQRVMPEN